MRDNHNERAEKDIVVLPLTRHELTVVMRCLGVACESERTDAADKQTVGLIWERIGRFAEPSVAITVDFFFRRGLLFVVFSSFFSFRISGD